MNEVLNQLLNWVNQNSTLFLELGFGIIAILIAFHFIISSICDYIRDPKLRSQVRKGLRTFEIITIVLFIGLVFSSSLRHLIFSLSAVTAVGSFALKELASSLSGWVAITFGNLYKHGDRVQIGDTVGDVIEVSLTQTILMECGEWLENDSYTGRIVHINNSKVVQNLIFNYTKQFPFIWDAIWIPIDYDSDRNLASKLIKESIKEVVSDQIEQARKQWASFPHKSSLIEMNFDPGITLNSNKDYMEFKITYLVKYSERGAIKNTFFHYLLNKFDEHSNQVKFPVDRLVILSNTQS